MIGRGVGTRLNQRSNKSRRGNGRGMGHSSGRGRQTSYQQEQVQFTRSKGRGRAKNDGQESQQSRSPRSGPKVAHRLTKEELNFLRKKSDDDGFIKQPKKGPLNSSTPMNSNKSSSRLSPEQRKGLEAIGLGPKSSFVYKVVSNHI